MPPALLLVGFGRARRFILPLPIFLLWPLLLLAWVVLGLGWLIFSGRSRPGLLVTGLMGLRIFGELRGTKVDVRGQDGSIYLHFV